MEFMASLPDNAYDLAIVDPPYGIGDKKLTQGGTWANKYKKGSVSWDEKPEHIYFEELFRVSKNQIIWGGNYFVNHLNPSMGWIFWNKGQKLTMSDGELAYTSFEKALREVTINRCKIGDYGGFIHRTQKPVQLYKWLLMNYAKQGDKILDTHGGSMSIAIACHELDFDLELCEIDKEYFDNGVKRFNNHISQTKLF